MSTQVFISYRVIDSLLTNRLETELVGRGYKVWRDIRDIAKGRSWIDEIDRGLQSSDVILACVTPMALSSRNVRNEWLWAERTGKRLIFIAWEKIEWFPPSLGDLPVVAFTSAYSIQRNAQTEDVIGLQVHESDEMAAFKILDDLLKERSSAVTLTFSQEAKNFHDAEIIARYSNMGPQFPPDWRHMQDLRRNVWSLLDRSPDVIDTVVNTPYVTQGTLSFDSNQPLIEEVNRLFHQSGGRLVIAGPLGTGKTTILRALTRSMLLNARDNPWAPVPVWLPVSHLGYGVDASHFFASNIQAIYGVDTGTAQRWLDFGSLCIIIDGIGDLYKYDFIREIILQALLVQKNVYPFFRFALSLQQQELVPPELETCNVSMRLLPDAMIEDYVREFEELDGLRAALDQSVALRESTRTVFLLQAARRAYASVSREELLEVTSDPFSYEYRTIERFVKAQLHTHAAEYDPKLAIRWLSILATEMKGFGAYMGGMILWGFILNPSSYWLTEKERRLERATGVVASACLSCLLAFLFLYAYDLISGNGFMQGSFVYLLVAALPAVGLGLIAANVFNRIYRLIADLSSEHSFNFNQGDDTISEMARRFIRARSTTYQEVYGPNSVKTSLLQELLVEDGGEKMIGMISLRSQSLLENLTREFEVKSIVFVMTSVLTTTYLFFTNNDFRQSILFWTIGAMLLLQIVPSFWRFIKRRGKAEQTEKKLLSPAQIFLLECAVTALIGLCASILISSIKTDVWYLMAGILPAILQATVELVRWWRIPEIEKQAKPGEVIAYMVSPLFGAIRGALFSLPGFLSIPTAQWLVDRLNKHLSKRLYATGRFPPNAYAFIKSMERCGFVRLVENEYCSFIHPLVQQYFEDHQ